MPSLGLFALLVRKDFIWLLPEQKEACCSRYECDEHKERHGARKRTRLRKVQGFFDLRGIHGTKLG